MNPLERNLSVIERRFPASWNRLRDCQAARTIRFAPAKSGLSIPYETGEVREYPLHSAVDPQREAARSLRIAGDAGYLICYGLGLGYHLEDMVRENRREILLIVDTPARLRTLLGERDLTHILGYPRLRLLLEPDPDEISKDLIKSYLPGLHGALATIILGGLQQRAKKRLAEINQAVQTALAAVKQDFSVQAHFGRVWTRNTLINLSLFDPALQQESRRLAENIDRTRAVALIGAGASLSANLPLIASNYRRLAIIATDTALPPLLEWGIQPDLVVSIDAQYYTLLHAEHPGAREIPWLLPLTAPPSLTRLLKRPFFFNGGTPLESFAAPQLGIQRYDTSGGNVLQTALDWIENNNFLRLTLYGADYLNIKGLPYALGSYVYRWFQCRSDRTRPLHSRLLSFCFDSRLDEPLKPYDEDYPNQRLDLYRERIETYLASKNLDVDSRGPTRIRQKHCAGETEKERHPAAAGSRVQSDERRPSKLIPRLIELVSSDGKEAIPLLYPLIAYLRHRESVYGASVQNPLEEARSLFLSLLNQFSDTER